MAVGQQRGAGLYVGPHESFERGRAIVRYHGEADATGTRIEIFRVLASWPGLIGVAIDHLDGPDDEDFASIAGLEECVALAGVDGGLNPRLSGGAPKTGTNFAAEFLAARVRSD